MLVRVPVLLSEELVAAIDAVADGRSRSEMIRRALGEHFGVGEAKRSGRRVVADAQSRDVAARTVESKPWDGVPGVTTARQLVGDYEREPFRD